MPRKIPFIVLAGRNTVHDALASQKAVKTVLLASNNEPNDKLNQIMSLAKKASATIEKVSPDELTRVSERSSHQGVVALMELPEPPTLEQIVNSKPNAFILLLNSLDYEQNLGAIMRTAWAAGVDAVVVNPSGVHEVTPVVAKVSMGGVAYVPLISQSLFQALNTLRKLAVPVVGVEVDLGEEYTKAKLSGPVAMVLGGEAAGLTEPLKKYCDSFIHIPMVKNIASLNVSVATAIVVFEKRRQDGEIKDLR